MLRFTCPTCSTITYFPDSKVGRQTWCPNCQNDFRVHSAQPAQAPAAKPPRRGKRAALMTALVALPLIGITAWALTSSPGDESDSLLDQLPTLSAPSQEVSTTHPSQLNLPPGLQMMRMAKKRD